jgi:hypothetical protein
MIPPLHCLSLADHIHSENNDPAAIKHFSWIPNEILHISNSTQEAKCGFRLFAALIIYVGSCRLAAERVIADFVFPLPSPSSALTSKSVDVDEVVWTDRLLNTMSYLDDRGVNAVLLLSGIKGSRPSPYELYLQNCIQNNVGFDLSCSGFDVHLMHRTRAVSSTTMRRPSNSDSTMSFDTFLVSLTTYDHHHTVLSRCRAFWGSSKSNRRPAYICEGKREQAIQVT